MKVDLSLPPHVETPPHSTVTRLLHAVQQGDDAAKDSLIPMIYSELHDIARGSFRNERHDHTLQPTALIHEAWLKLAGHLDRREDALENRRHFFILASRAMRQVLADHARSAVRQKRGDGRMRVTLDPADGARTASGFDLVELEDALSRLSKLNARHAQVVELHLLAGLTIPETAEALGVSRATVETDWFTAKAWLRTKLGAGERG